METDNGPISAIDWRIVELLQADARRTYGSIGAQVGLSAPAVKRRVDWLEALGVILGYTAVVDHAVLGKPLAAFIELRFAGTTKVNDIEAIGAAMPEIDALFTVAGDPDAIAHVRVRDVEDLKRVIDGLRRGGKITGTKTMMVLDSARSLRGRVAMT